MESSNESALVILVPEAEALVKPFRDKYDPLAAKGMVSHVTLLYPFKAPDEISIAVTHRLQSLFAALPRFTLSFAEIRRFPGVLYLAPTPESPVKALAQAIAREFPDARPYGGAFAEIIPHLTVVQVADEQQLDAIAAEFSQAAQKIFPIEARVTEVALMDDGQGTWQVRGRFGLANNESLQARH